MCNWFPCHVPSFQWQGINNAALTKQGLCVHVYHVLTVRTLLFEGQRLWHYADVTYTQILYSPTAFLWQSHMDQMNYLNVTLNVTLWLSSTCAAFIALPCKFDLNKKGYRSENMHLRFKNSVNIERFFPNNVFHLDIDMVCREKLLFLDTMTFDSIHVQSSKASPWPLTDWRKLFS